MEARFLPVLTLQNDMILLVSLSCPLFEIIIIKKMILLQFFDVLFLGKKIPIKLTATSHASSILGNEPETPGMQKRVKINK